jgi:hypothetical protein
MSRRSYLQRIAEPLRPGDPVLFAVPQPSPAEARPTAEMPTSHPAATLRRATTDVASTTAAKAPGTGVAPAAPPAAGAAPPRGVIARDQRLATAPFAASSAPSPPLAAKRATPLSAYDAPAPRTAMEEHPDPTAGEAAVESSFAPSPIPPGRVSAPHAMALDPVRSEPPISVAPVPRAIPNASAPEPLHRPPYAPLASSADRAAPAPRVHIGTVEVRSSAPTPAPAPAPPAAPAAPHRAATPIARGYAWRFGLIQG